MDSDRVNELLNIVHSTLPGELPTLAAIRAEAMRELQEIADDLTKKAAEKAKAEALKAAAPPKPANAGTSTLRPQTGV